MTIRCQASSKIAEFQNQAILCKYKLIWVIFCFLVHLKSLTNGYAQEIGKQDHILETVSALLETPENQIDLVRSNLIINKLVDPTVDVEKTVRILDEMALASIRIAGANANNDLKISALRTYIYQDGNWNGHRPFSYNMDDPFGTNLESKLLTNYLDNRLGNCVSMPFLFMAVAERMGITLSASTAPNHIFLKYQTDSGQLINLETTSGANPSRDAWIREQMPMTDKAIANGVYLKALSKKETVVVMAMLLLENAHAEGRYGTVLDLVKILLPHYPNNADLEVHRGAAAYKILERNFYNKYPQPQMIPKHQRSYYYYLSQINEQAFNRAEALGWRPEGQVN